jgi:hypothetical protein
VSRRADHDAVGSASSILLVGVQAMPGDALVGELLLAGPLWKAGEITVWSSGRRLAGVEPCLADLLASGTLWSCAVLRQVPQPSQRWITTLWPRALVVESGLDATLAAERWSQTRPWLEKPGVPTLSVLRPFSREAPEPTSRKVG